MNMHETRNDWKAILGASLVLLVALPSVQAQSWGPSSLGAGTFDWNNAANWNPNTSFPDAVGAAAVVNANITGAQTLNLNQAVTLGSLTIGDTNNNNKYTIANGTAGSLTFDNGLSAATLVQGNQSNGDTISATVFLKGNLNVSNAQGANNLNLTGAISSSATSGTQTISLNGGNVAFSGGSSLLSDGVTGGQLALAINGGTISLGGGVHTFSGGITLNAGTLTFNTTSPGAGAITINGGTMSANFGLTLNTNNAQAWNGNFTFGGTNALNMGTGAVTLGSHRVVNVTNTGTVTVGGVIGDGASGYSLTKLGGGTLALGGANTYSGGTRMLAGTLNLSGANNFGTGGVDVYGGTLNLSGASAWGDTVLHGGILSFSNNSLNSTGDLIFAGSATLRWNGNTNDLSSHNVSVAAGATATFDINGNNVILGDSFFDYVISGAGGIAVRNSSTATGAIFDLDGANTYIGGTQVLANPRGIASTLRVTTSGTLGANVTGNDVTVQGGSKLWLTDASNIGGNQEILLGSTGGGQVILSGMSTRAIPGGGAATLILGGDFLPNISSDSTPGGVIALDGLSSFTAITDLSTVGGGYLYLGANSASSFTGASLAAGAGNTYRLGGGGSTLTINGDVLTGSGTKVEIGSLLAGGQGTVSLGGSNDYTGGTRVNDGSTLIVTSGGSDAVTPLGSGGVDVIGTLRIGGADGSLVDSSGGALNTVNLYGRAPSIVIDNTTNYAGGNAGGRWGDSTGVTLNNATLGFLGAAGNTGTTSGNSETIGQVTFSGVSTLAPTRGASGTGRAVALTVNPGTGNDAFIRSGSGILLIRPSATGLLGGDEKILVGSGNAPVNTSVNGGGGGSNQIAPTWFVNSTDKTFVYYDGTDGFKNTAFSSATLATSTATDVVNSAAVALSGNSTVYALRSSGNLTSSASGTARTVDVRGGAVMFNAGSNLTHTDLNLKFTSDGSTLAEGILYNFNTGTNVVAFGTGSTIQASSLILTGNPFTFSTSATVYNGDVLVDNGSINLGSASSLGSSATVTLRNSTLSFTTGGSTTFDVASFTVLDAAFIQGNNATNQTWTAKELNLNSSVAGQGSFLTVGTLSDFSNNQNVVFQTVNLNDHATVSVFNGAAQDGGSAPSTRFQALGASNKNLTKTGLGRLVIGGANTGYTGSVTVGQGALEVTNLNSLGADTNAAPTVEAGAVLEINVADYGDDSSTATVRSNTNMRLGSAERWGNANARLAQTGGSIYTLAEGVSLQLKGFTANPSSASTLRLDGGSIQSWGGTASTLGANVGVELLSDSRLGRTGIDAGGISDLTINGVISGNYGITKIGTDNVILAGANTYTGDTIIQEGTLAITNAAALPGGAGKGNVTVNSILNLNVGSNPTIAFNGLNGGGAVLATQSATLSVGGNDQNGNFSGILQEAGTSVLGLTKTGNGTQVLSGAQTYRGATTVAAGTLLVNGSLDSASAVAVAGGAVLGGSGTIGGLITTAGTGSVISPGNSPGVLTLSGGLDASLGVTFNFELGITSDLLDLESSVFTGSTAAGGLIFNFSDTGGLLEGNPYTLLNFGSSSGLDYTDLFANILPSGFVLDSSFGSGGWMINGTDLQVQFATVPEPSTYAMFGLGLLSLYIFRRRRGV